MRRSIVAITAVAALAGSLLGVAPAQAATSYSVQTMHFAVQVGPTQGTSCDVVGDLYLPADAMTAHRVPAIMMTNGWGQTKDDLVGAAEAFVGQDYAVLAYSGLGWGGSTCRITIDDPAYDGAAASRLVSFLGGRPGIAFSDAAHTEPLPALRTVVHDRRDHAGVAQQYDPRVGMFGFSYGGEVQFAAASVDPRIDTIVPLGTWNDLSYSLDPNGATQTSGVSTATPGAAKTVWLAGLLALAEKNVVTRPISPSDLVGCPGAADFYCAATVSGLVSGVFTQSEIDSLRAASVASYVHRITVPVLLAQGQQDTLFRLDEAAATYTALKQQGTPVKMVWELIGHDSPNQTNPGDISLTDPDFSTQFLSKRLLDWYDHYLKGSTVGTGPNFSYYRDWVPYSGSSEPAYGESSTFPVGTPRTYFLSGRSALVDTAGAATAGSQTLLTPPAGAPTSIDPVNALGLLTQTDQPSATVDVPGTAASWTSSTLTTPLDVVGSPTLHLTVSAPTAALTQAAGPAGQLVLFAKLEDVAPDGTASLIRGQVAPVRVPNAQKPLSIVLPGIVHRFDTGHRLRLVVAGGSIDYRGGLISTPVSISGGAGQVLSLPSVP